MAFISNQWLGRGQGARSRGYKPVFVLLDCAKSRDEWSERNDTNVEFTATKLDDEYQTLHLSQVEVDAIAKTIVESMSLQAREKLIVDLLGPLSNAKLLRLVALDLRNRVRLPDER